MRKTFWYILGGQLATISIPALAQDVGDDGTMPPADAQPAAPMMTPGQMAVVDTWPAEKQAQFRNWPGDVQAYFWTLEPERQEVFWRLADGDKLALVAMDEAGRTAAWSQIDQQMGPTAEGPSSAAPPPAEGTTATEDETPAEPEPTGRP